MKRSQHKVQQTIDVTPAQAWAVIGTGTNVDKWLAPITSCRVEGAKRYCGTEAGQFEEDILKIDHENKVFTYAIPSQHILPVENIRGYMAVQAAPGNKATIEWAWEYDVSEENEVAAKDGLEMTGNMGIRGIEAYIRQAAITLEGAST